jgi:hypothetical protein
MKYTRLEIKRSFSNSRFKLIIEFFLFIPIIAIVSGSLITKVFIAPHTIQAIDTPAKTDIPAIAAVSMETKSEYSMFVLQAGAFVSKKNADILQNGIKANGVNALVIKDLDVFRVIIDICDNKDLLTEKKDKLKLAGYECLINVINFKNSLGDNTAEESSVKEYIGSVMSILSLEINLKENIDKSTDVNTAEFSSFVEDISAKYKKISEAGTNTKLAPVIGAFNEKFLKSVGNFKNSFDKKDINVCQQNAAEQVMMVNSFYKTIIQTFIK